MGNPTAWRLALLCAACASACGTDQSNTPSVVGRSWELQIGGTQDQEPTASEIEFVGLEDVEVVADPRYKEDGRDEL